MLVDFSGLPNCDVWLDSMAGPLSANQGPQTTFKAVKLRAKVGRVSEAEIVSLWWLAWDCDWRLDHMPAALPACTLITVSDSKPH